MRRMAMARPAGAGHQGVGAMLKRAAHGVVRRECDACAREDERKRRIHPKLRMTEPDDAVELEADRAADAVMRMPSPAGREDPAAVALSKGVLTRSSSGQPLSDQERGFFEPRFGFDFSQVRVHADVQAASDAAALGARAFTWQSDIFYGAGEYAPGSAASRHLTAHELAHVVQQSNDGNARLARRLRVENPTDALPGAPPKQHWQEIRDYVAALSSGFQVDAAGDVTPTGANVCSAGPLRMSESCLCELSASSNDWKIKIDDLAWPHTEDAAHRVTVHSTRSPVEFGSWGGGPQAGMRIAQGNPRVLGHELCGHALLMERGTHPSGPPPVFVGGRMMGRPSHDPTVAIENQVASEMAPGAPTRGSFADPHHGESFARVTVTGYATNATDPVGLPADMLARLQRVRDAMAADSLLRADIVGHSDPAGTPAERAATSRARAWGVRDHLRGPRVPASRFLVVRGEGANECPSAPTDNPDCRKTEVFMYLFQGASLRNP